MRAARRVTLAWLAAAVSGGVGCRGAGPVGTTLETGDGSEASSTGGSAADGGWSPDLPDTGVPQFTEVGVAAGFGDGPPSTPIAAPDCLGTHTDPGSGAICTPLLLAGGAAVADFDDDGWPDVFLPRIGAPDQLMRNRGDGTFVDVAAARGLALDESSAAAAWGDVDRDGDLDLYVTGMGTEGHRLWINDGAGSFADEGVLRGAATFVTGSQHSGTTPTFADIDLDGDLDLYVGEWVTSLVRAPGEPFFARLLENDGSGFFADITESAGVGLGDPDAGVFAFGAGFTDLDADGLVDMALVADFGGSRLFWGRQGGGFEDGTVAAGVGTDENGMGAVLADVDGDGRLDWFVTSVFDAMDSCGAGGCGWGSTGNRLYLNRGNRAFEDATAAWGVRDGAWGWGAVAVDVDHDGDLDLAETNGWRDPWLDGQPLVTDFKNDPMRLWVGDAGASPEIAAPAGLNTRNLGRALVRLDFDRDGDADLLEVVSEGRVHLYRNDGADPGAAVTVELRGDVGTPYGRGVRVAARAGGIDAWQIREVGLDALYGGHGELDVQFGLGTASQATIRACWPVSRRMEERTVPTGQRVVLHESDATQPITEPCAVAVLR